MCGFEFGKFGNENYAHCNREALDDGVVEGGGQGGGVEGFRFFKVCNTLDVGLHGMSILGASNMVRSCML